MSTQIQRRRGTTTEHSSFTGAEGEITIDTTKDTVVVHDGSRAGGFPLAHENNPSFTGNVGVGIDSAATKLHIESSDSDAAKIRLGFNSTRYYDIFRGSSTNSGYLNFYGSQSGSTGYVFGGADGERMRIDTAGRLRFGTTTKV